MHTTPDELKVSVVLELKAKQMLVVNPEYQRGEAWSQSQKKKLVDSVLRGYPVPLFYFHQITQKAGTLVSQRYEIIDGQQRINALSDFSEGAFKLFDPVQDETDARFPDFIKKQPCPWARKTFQELPEELRTRFVDTVLRIVQIETDDPHEARDLFVRLQAGMPLNSQEKRDAWPGQFTDFVLRLGGKTGIQKYPGHDFFNDLMRARRTQDRGRVRQLAAQIAMLFFTRREKGKLRNINAPAIDDYYYENLDFDAAAPNAHRLIEVLDKVTALLNDQKRRKIIGHEAIHLVLFVDALMDDYTRAWESEFGKAFDLFRENLAKATKTRYEPTPNEFWLSYGVGTRVNSDREEVIQRRHEFFANKMRLALKTLQIKDPQRTFGILEREIIYYRDKKMCGDCGVDVKWDEAEIHHIEPHRHGGVTGLDNGVLVHRQCHPKGEVAETAFAKKWRQRLADAGPATPTKEEVLAAAEDDEV